MKIAVRSHGSDVINSFGGGESRWVNNLAHFLRTEGHEVHRIHQHTSCDSTFNLYLDAAWEDCHRIASSVPHVHFSFFACNTGAQEFQCLRSGQCVMAVPYRLQWVINQNWKKTIPYKFTNIFIPQPYPDDLLPAKANQIRGFDRQEIMWATKDMFHPNFSAQQRPDGREHVFTQGGLDTLRALLRLQQRTDFKIHFLMAHFLEIADPRLGVRELVSQFRDAAFYGNLPWTSLIDIASGCKLNAPVGGLWGSIPESIFAKGLPMFFQRNCWSNEFGTLLPFPENADEQDIYEALEALWFDERIYQRNFEIQQALFEDHRTEGLRKNIKIAFEKLGF